MESILVIKIVFPPSVATCGNGEWTGIEAWKNWANFFKFKCDACENHQQI